jgi:hypothetical protein
MIDGTAVVPGARTAHRSMAWALRLPEPRNPAVALLDAQDTFFYDPNTAREVALQGNLVSRTKWFSVRQMCYYTGSLVFSDAPPTLVHVPIDDLAGFFTRAQMRLPTALCFPTSGIPLPAEEQQRRNHFSQVLQVALNEACNRMNFACRQYCATMQENPVTVAPGEPLRVFAPGSISTTVMQHCSRNLLEAFARLGHHTSFMIERDDLHRLGMADYQSAALEFAPHVVIGINHRNHELVPPGGVNAIWWQDMMDELVDGRPIEWRANDLVYVLSRERFAPLLERSGLPPERIKVQPFCIDRDLFNEHGAGAREDLAVFVGSSYIRELCGKDIERSLLGELEERFSAGEGLSAEAVLEAARRHRVTPEWADWKVLHYVARDLPVRWLCRQRDVRVEVYGRDWDRDPVVAPFFKGELPQGRPVADLYRRARWALVLHPDMVNHQRLGEVGACGCIPVVYDCRFRADGPHWDGQVLYFRTQEQLAGCLRRTIPVDAQAFGEFFDYANFARRIIADAQPLLARSEAASLVDA